VSLSVSAQPFPHHSPPLTSLPADGSIARGNVWTDTISLGGTTVPNATLESAVNVSPELSGDRDSAGVFGLAYSLPTGTSPQQPAVLPALLQHLPQALFTVDLRHGSNASSSSSAANNSAYTFGYIDSSRHLSSSPIRTWNPSSVLR
jgi:hypothetical protein